MAKKNKEEVISKKDEWFAFIFIALFILIMFGLGSFLYLKFYS